jgi:hypothetical protein
MARESCTCGRCGASRAASSEAKRASGRRPSRSSASDIPCSTGARAPAISVVSLKKRSAIRSSPLRSPMSARWKRESTFCGWSSATRLNSRVDSSYIPVR